MKRRCKVTSGEGEQRCQERGVRWRGTLAGQGDAVRRVAQQGCRRDEGARGKALLDVAEKVARSHQERGVRGRDVAAGREAL